jgi:hypothetical protein
VRLCLCALLFSCTDPRARPAAPSVQLAVSPTLVVTSPGSIPASVYAFDAQGLDSIVVSVRSPVAALQGDSSYFLPDTSQQTISVVWTVPAGVPGGTSITLTAKAFNVLGIPASDSAILAVRP